MSPSKAYTLPESSLEQRVDERASLKVAETRVLALVWRPD